MRFCTHQNFSSLSSGSKQKSVLPDGPLTGRAVRAGRPGTVTFTLEDLLLTEIASLNCFFLIHFFYFTSLFFVFVKRKTKNCVEMKTLTCTDT